MRRDCFILLLLSCGCDFKDAQARERLFVLERRIVGLEEELAEKKIPKKIEQPPPPPQPKPEPKPAWLYLDNWRRLRKGMTQGDVQRILGPSTRVLQFSTWCTWEYGTSGAVRFDVAGRCASWSEPL